MAPRKKQPRRKPGTGAIRFKKARALQWEAAFPIGHNQHRYDYFATRSEAETHLDQLVRDRDSAAQPRDVAGGSQRTDTFLTSWLNIKRGKIKEKTWLGYKYYCELACEEIGVYRVDEVSREKADAMLSYFHGRGFQNVSQLRACLRQAFEYALEEDYIKKNPFQKAKAAPVERRTAITLSRAERDRLLLAAKGTPHEALWHLYSRLGFRRGEGIGPRWGDIDFDQATIRVVQTFVEVGSKTTRSTPKTPKSIRLVPLPPDVVDLLRELKIAQRARAANAPIWKEHGLVFPTSKGTPISPRNIVRTFKALLKRANLSQQITIHDLRHTADYLMESSGVPRSARMAVLGHTTVAMDLHYSNHADLDAMRAAVASA